MSTFHKIFKEVNYTDKDAINLICPLNLWKCETAPFACMDKYQKTRKQIPNTMPDRAGLFSSWGY